MRTLLLMFLVLLVSAGGFYAYLQIQTTPPRSAESSSNDTLRPQQLRDGSDSVGDLGPGARPWVKVYDKERRLSYMFRAREYAPEQAGRIEVQDPEAEFFQYVRDEDSPNGIRTQRIQLVGKTGEVEVQAGPEASADKGFNKGAAGPPKRGLLSDVTIRMFHRFGDDEPRLTITAPNVSFDNESFEIATRGYTNEAGVHVPPDQVPILADGKDYAFSGRGLTLRWNDVDGRLEHLEIAHGDYLQIKNPGALAERSSPKSGPATAPVANIAQSGRTGGPIVDETGAPLALVDASPPTSRKSGLPKTRPARPKKPAQPPYRATFDHDVRISEGQMNVDETELARADVMFLDFLAGSSDKPATQPATKPDTAPAADPLSQPAPDATTVKPKDKEPKRADTRPATQPVQKPIIVRWSGKLRVVPLEGTNELPTPLKPGETVLRFFGQSSPVRLSRGLNRIDCTAADYFTSDDSVLVRGSERHGPVVLRQLPDPTLPPGQSRQATVVTQLLNYSGAEQVATLTGKSNATFTLPREPAPKSATQPATLPTTQPGDPDIIVTVTKEPPQVVTASWSQQGKLRFKDGLAGEMTFDRADFTGDVDVNHPQLALKSQELALLFEERIKPATRPATGPATKPGQPVKPSIELELKQVIATNDVWADLIDADGQKQTVTTDRLVVDTASDGSGKLYPRLVTAIGNTHAFDEKQSLRAGGVELTMAPIATPTTRPSTLPSEPLPTQPATGQIDTAAVELKHMRAWDGVVVSSVDGATAAGDSMTVDIVAGQPLVRLIGKPLAAVTDPKGSTIVGPVIDIDPDRSWAKVTGRGSIRAVQSDDDKSNATTQPALAGTRPVKPPKFLDVVWETEAEMDGAKDRIFIAGPVLVSSTDADGTLNTARGRRAVIELSARPAPATQPTKLLKRFPATQPATDAAGEPATRPKKPATKPSKPRKATGLAGLGGEGGMDLFKDKYVSAVSLEEEAVVNSTLSDESGILRQFELKSQKVRYEAGTPPAATATTEPSTRPSGGSAGGPLALGASGNGRLIVPGAGTMIYRDHRPTTRPATRPATAPAGAAVASTRPAKDEESQQARGATAFWWKDSLVYDQASKAAVLDGGVVIVHQPDTGEPRVQVNTDRAIARFDEKPSTRPATNRSREPKSDEDRALALQLKWLTLDGGVVVTRGPSQLTAQKMDYDPATGWMVAVGTRQNPATYVESQGQQTFFADEVHWNVETWLTKFVGLRGGAGTEGIGKR